MNRFVTLLIGSALTSLVAANGFAADAAPEAAKPAPAAQPVVAAAPAQDAATAPAAPSVPAAPAPAATAAPSAAGDAAGAVPTREFKMGYVNMSKIAAESAQGKAATEKLKDKSEKLRAKIEARQKQIEKQKAAIEAKLPTMTPKERQAKGNEFQKKIEDYQKMVRAGELEVAEMQGKLTEEVFAVIKQAAGDYAKANGYALLVEEKGVLFAAEGIKSKDLTDEIIETMNKKHPSKK